MKNEITLLQEKLKEKGYAAAVLQNADYHGNEYLSEYFKILQFFSGFTGSNALLLVTLKNAVLWTDSRYFIQAENELDGSGIELAKQGEDGVLAWDDYIIKNLHVGSAVLMDLDCVSISFYKDAIKKFEKHNILLKADSFDFLNSIWSNRPELEFKKIYALDQKECGASRTTKIKEIKAKLKDDNFDAMLLSSLDEIAWILNLRGSDIKYNPFFYSYFLIMKNGVSYLFASLKNIELELIEELKGQNIELLEYKDVFNFLITKKINKIILPKTSTVKITELFGQRSVKYEESIVKNLKAIKNKKEITNIKKAMVQDGVALVKAFMQMEKKLESEESVDEYEMDNILFESRASSEGFISPSFSSIVGFKENGAIVHYTAQKDNCKKIEKDGMLLVDSGGQYFYGTTDITRTLYTGECPSDDEIEKYTLVLKAHIALSRVIFPLKTPIKAVDAIARAPLWEYGLNYGHGTSHGVGFLLGVHESLGSNSESKTFEEGNLISNEPGYYKEGKFGIRIENLILVKKSKDFDKFFEFETLTLFPYERKLINKKLLKRKEVNWINAYHKKVYKELSKFLNNDENLWLEKKTSKL